MKGSPKINKGKELFLIELSASHGWCVRAQSLSCVWLWSHGLYLTRLLCPRNLPDKNTGVCSHLALQGIFPPGDWTHISCTAGRFLSAHHLGSLIPWLDCPPTANRVYSTSRESRVSSWRLTVKFQEFKLSWVTEKMSNPAYCLTQKILFIRLFFWYWAPWTVGKFWRLSPASLIICKYFLPYIHTTKNR